MKQILCVTLLCSALITSGCSSTKDINVISTPREKTKLELSLPAKLNLQTFDWDVITPNNVTLKFSKLLSKHKQSVFICTSPEEYVIMSTDIEKLQSYIIELHSIISQNKAYYEQTQ